MKLSIVIPAYNAGLYIASCLQSLYSQNMSTNDFEVIVINDGSTDNTLEIVESFKKKYTNLRIVNQENRGNGAARNVGVNLAQGTYLYFLDADDYIAHNSLKKLISVLENKNLDILGFASKVVTNDTHTTANTIKIEAENSPVYNGIDFIAQHNYDAEIWWYIIKKSFFLTCDISFYDRKFVQDSYFTPTLFSKATKITYLPLDVHRYRRSTNSITRNKSEAHLRKHFKDLSFAIEKISQLLEVLKKRELTNIDALKRIRVKQQRYVFLVIVRFFKSNLHTEELKEMLVNYKKLDAYPIAEFARSSDYNNITYKMSAFIFNRSYLLYPAIRIYHFFKK